MNKSKKPQAMIVGGSLGGLFTAAALQAIGWEVDVFERSPHELDSRGGGLVLQADVLAAFRFAGIANGEALGVRSDDRIVLDPQDRVIHRQFMPQTQTSWNKLYGALRAALPDANRHAGEEFLDFELQGERVHARFASGREASADLLIGADGARSAVRAQLLPDRVPSYAGYVAWRGLVPEAQVPPAVAQRLGQAFAFQHGPRHQLLQYLVPGEDGSTEPGRRRRNWVWYRPVAPGDELARVLTDREGVRHAFSLPPGAPAPAVIDEMRQAAGQLLAPSFQHLVAATREPFLQAILDLRTPQMVFGRVLLLGDAAFVPRPHTAGGAAKAAADATALAVALRDGPGTLEQALAQWQRTQLTQGQALVDWGVTLGNRMMGLDETGRA